VAFRAEHPFGRPVLVVDDEPIVRSFVLRALGEAGFQALEAASGSEALALLGTGGAPAVGLVITDWSMPGMSGVQLAARLAEQWAGLPVLLVSGQEPTGWSGPFLPKPFTPDQLVEVVRNLASRTTVA
jgi:DNA-binding response OmpR family regulator